MDQTNLEELFNELLQLESDEQRHELLDRACANCPELRQQLEKLLAAAANVGSFLDVPDWASTVDHSASDLVGTNVGPYRIRELIGEGGMGSVYVAEQETPIRRKVALKLIKPGMDSKSVIARFEAERQALALMDHPHIAKVLDAGTTAQGRPYFAMELVKGIPITDFCDQNRLSIHARLQLFKNVCHALQHAHLKGIIHRDIKPSNVLVTLHDGKPVPKVIDFGVAKALSTRLTDKTIYTEHYQVVGTLLYMSPEQAELSGLDIDTRSDVYSLGVLLYELITGTTPFQKEELHKAGLDEQRRIIREKDPPRASVRISSLGHTATVVANLRNTDTKQLNQSVRGDLDWILVKALERDRSRRYESAGNFAADIGRHLSDETIQARPHSAVYSLRKFTHRNRAALAILLVVIALALTAIVGTGSMAFRWRATLTRLRATSHRQAVLSIMLGDDDGSMEAFDVARTAGTSREDLQVIEGLSQVNRGRYDAAIKIAEEILAEKPEHVGARSLLTYAVLWTGNVGRWATECNALERLDDPDRDADRVLMAYALVLHDSSRASRLIAESRTLSHTPAGLLIVAQDLTFQAEEQQSTELGLEAVRDYEAVLQFMPENSNVAGWYAAGLASVITLLNRDGTESRDFVGKAERVLNEMQGAESSGFLDWSKWRLYRAIGKPNEASLAIRQLRQSEFCWAIATDCMYRYPEVADALREFDAATVKFNQKTGQLRLARAFAAFGSNDLTKTDDLSDLINDGHALNRVYALSALYLTQGFARAKEEASKLDTLADSGSKRHANQLCLRYLQDPTPENEQFILQEAPCTAYAQVNVHFVLGVVELAKGNEQGAIRYLQKSAEHPLLGNISYEYASALLVRLGASHSSEEP
ncbi:MAG: protein kinase [Pirellulaceae bacterium]